MPERVLTLPWGESEISLSLPENWRLVGTPEPSSLPGVEDMMAEVRANLPFVEFVDDVEAGLALARKRFPGPAEVLVFPHGGVTYPIMD